jgi:hypothetical protein
MWPSPVKKMATDGNWFEVYHGTDLEQGDILFDCPCFTVSGIETWPPPADVDLSIEEERFTSIILTQTCDLLNHNLSDVLLAQVVPWEIACHEMVAQGNKFAKSKDYRNALVQGNIPGLSLLHRFDDLSFPWSVVNFHKLFTLPRNIVAQVAKHAGPRLRLLSPYKEHVAQAFARYFMRVGLPHVADAFIAEGKVDF